jgi:hypothetical protein
MPYFNKDTAEKIASHEGTTLYRLKSGKYVVYDNEKGTNHRVDFLYAREYLGRLPTRKLNKALAVPDKRLNMNVRIPMEIKAKLWTLAEYEGVNIQTYLTKVLVEHVTNSPDPKYKRMKVKKRRTHENNKQVQHA